MESKTVTVQYASKQLGMSVGTLRDALIQGVFPFGVAIRKGTGRYVYYINKERFEAYMKGSYDVTPNTANVHVGADATGM